MINDELYLIWYIDYFIEMKTFVQGELALKCKQKQPPARVRGFCIEDQMVVLSQAISALN